MEQSDTGKGFPKIYAVSIFRNSFSCEGRGHFEVLHCTREPLEGREEQTLTLSNVIAVVEFLGTMSFTHICNSCLKEIKCLDQGHSILVTDVRDSIYYLPCLLLFLLHDQER